MLTRVLVRDSLTRMKILFCAKTNLSRELGASKVLIELAEEMRKLGWNCDLLSPADLLPAENTKGDYGESLRQHLHRDASRYDVVDYDHNDLPYSRSEFDPNTLLVARSVLLAHHFDKIPIPEYKGLKSRLRSITVGRLEAKRRTERIERAHKTVSEADLINVTNYDDKSELMRRGISERKITVIPDGISKAQRQLLESSSNGVPPKPKVAFIGTFDSRKGATDFPEIAQSILQEIPEATFRLLGTYRTRSDVLGFFPKQVRPKIEVVPQYQQEELPKLLLDCSAGIFPSYLEGFGLGVLEMLAASIPVVAYNSPGPTMMLSPDFLVEPGDIQGMSKKVVDLLNNKERLAAARREAHKQSQQFCWEPIAELTSQVYFDHLQRKRAR